MKTEILTRPLSPLPGKEPEITPLPTFDYAVAEEAKADTDRLGIDSDLYPSLSVASNLAYYNFRMSPLAHDPRAKRVLDMRLGALCRTEQDAAENPHLPTIGIEIETPTLPFYHHRRIFPTDYRSFFDTMGMPRNRTNVDTFVNFGDVARWEFSPSPTYSAHVQARIISELVQGKFIPSLINSQDPLDIERYLDPSLVSMHINIGVPKDMPPVEYDTLTEMKNLGVALAIAYSSGKRLEMRKMKEQNFAIHKAAYPTSKTDNPPMLIELKAMELRTELTYRSLQTAQLLFASLFDSKIHPDGLLATEWDTTLKEIQEFLYEKNYKPNPTLPAETSYEVARIAQRGVGSEIRGILENRARRIKRIIQPSEPQSLPEV